MLSASQLRWKFSEIFLFVVMESQIQISNFISSVPILNKPNHKERWRRYNLSFGFYNVSEMMNCRNGFCHSSAILHICEFQKSNSLLSNIKLAFRFFVVQLLQFKTSSIAISQYQKYANQTMHNALLTGKGKPLSFEK